MQKLVNVNGSWLAAGVIAAGIVVYLLTADVVNINDADKTPAPTPVTSGQEVLSAVQATHFKQEFVKRTLTLYGRTETDRTVTVSAELAARVMDILANRGELVTAGQEIVRLREGSLKAQLKSAEARIRQAEQDYQSALLLQKKKHIAENQITQLEAELAEALSQKEELQTQWDNTQIKAPIPGILNKRHVEVGDFLDKGNPVAEILDLDPLVVSVDVPQNSISYFKPGQKAEVRFLGGRTLEATIRFIDRQANSSTRTFSVELTIPNPNMKIPAGLSVEADLLMEEVLALEISPAWLALSEDGEPGIKWVTTASKVQFTPVDVVKSESDRLWVTGIPEQARIITRGQGFVRAGDLVDVVSPDRSLIAGE
ncbi:efflux RND transporter periplasmic adaptor subunit [Endozoicomonas sp.]|uniref:efflux RND transporter periplasmic adaptor subunit n=1 Tax=Endozoicomonas sp. TaxID=1892382 RepID=UPI00288534D7|nr:efflux RND transporter periplasmic adaptor subunit [Endozoicomonas sp.]